MEAAAARRDRANPPLYMCPRSEKEIWSRDAIGSARIAGRRMWPCAPSTITMRRIPPAKSCVSTCPITGCDPSWIRHFGVSAESSTPGLEASERRAMVIPGGSGAVKCTVSCAANVTHSEGAATWLPAEGVLVAFRTPIARSSTEQLIRAASLCKSIARTSVGTGPDLERVAVWRTRSILTRALGKAWSGVGLDDFQEKGNPDHETGLRENRLMGEQLTSKHLRLPLSSLLSTLAMAGTLFASLCIVAPAASPIMHVRPTPSPSTVDAPPAPSGAGGSCVSGARVSQHDAGVPRSPT